MAGGSRRAALRAAARERLRAGDDVAVAMSAGGERREEGCVVRQVLGSAAGAGKLYRCPGCDQEIRPGLAHLVAWPDGRPDDRRHWHTPCWAARGRRGVKVHRSKNAPRYG